MPGAPLFSIVTPVHNPAPKVLRRMLESVRSQTWTAWEHCVVDDGSTRPDVASILDLAEASDPRVSVRRRPRQGGIVAATQAGLDMANGDFVAFLDHDDELDLRALEVMAAAISAKPYADYLYSDEVKITESGRRLDTFLKPAWSPDRIRCQMYLGHLSVIRRSVLDAAGGIRDGFDGAQDWDLALRVSELTTSIVRVRDVLYHWRAVRGSAATSSNAKPWAHEASQRAVSEHLHRTGVQAAAQPVPGYPGHYWLRPELEHRPLVSIVLPTAGRSQRIDGVDTPLVLNCVRTLMERSTYRNFEIVAVVDGGAAGVLSDQLVALVGDRLRLVRFDQAFNFSRVVNLGAAEARGEYLLLLNDDTEVLPNGWRPSPRRAPAELPIWPTSTPDGKRTWLESMLVYAMLPGVGAVGAKLYFPDGRLQHAGVIGYNGAAGHAFYTLGGNNPGYWGNLISAGNFLAVTGACLMTSRAAFDAVGGFDPSLPINFNDVDFCLKLHVKGLRSLVVPEVELLHRESASRGRRPIADEEIRVLELRWGDLLRHDPYYDERFSDGNFNVRPDSLVAAGLAWMRLLYEEGGARHVVRRGVGKARREFERLARRRHQDGRESSRARAAGGEQH